MLFLFFSQLFYDGHQSMAVNLAQAIGVSNQPPPPSDKLFRLVSVAKQFVENTDSGSDEVRPKVHVSFFSIFLGF